MAWRNDEVRYGGVAMVLHWSMALVMLGLLALGLWMVELPDGDPKWGWYGWHKSFGLLVLMLAVVRVLWRRRNVQPAMPAGLAAWERFAAHATHTMLYLAMFVLPISGYVDSSAGGYHVAFFGLFELPLVIPKNEALLEAAVLVHQSVAYGLIGLLVLHVGAVLKQHFVLRNDVLRRMLPRR